MTRSTRLLESLLELSDNLKGYAEDLRRDGAYRCCMGTYEHVVAHIDAIVRESDASAPVAATLDEAAADPALTLDVARELLRDAAAGIRSLAASATPRTEPADGRPPKPAECANGCPPQQVCDHCQWPPGPDVEPVEGRESECPWDGCGDCVGHEVTPPAGDGVRVADEDARAVQRLVDRIDLDFVPGTYGDLGAAIEAAEPALRRIAALTARKEAGHE